MPREGSLYTFENPVMPPNIGDTTVERINKLNEYITSRGATLLVAAYPIGNGELTADPRDYVVFQENLKDRLDCHVISNFTDYMYDYSYFYDTNLHLNSQGAKLRTKQLIKDIKHWLETGEEAGNNKSTVQPK